MLVVCTAMQGLLFKFVGGIAITLVMGPMMVFGGMRLDSVGKPRRLL